LTYELCSPDCPECENGTIVIINDALRDIKFTNVISPNDDGQNDQLRFNNDDIIEGSRLTIFNRWGDTIYSTDDYQNNWTAEGYPSGVYFYVLEVSGVQIKKTLTVFK